MTNANYRDPDPPDDQTPGLDFTNPNDQPSTRPRPGSTAALINQPTTPKEPPATPPPAYQPPPTQPNRVGPDQSLIGGGLGPGGPGPTPQTGGAGPFGPFGLPQFRGADRQTYIPAMANRMPHEWGTDRRFPMLPQAWEVPGMYRGLGRKLSQFGPSFVAPFAAMMGQHSGAWMRGYMQGQEQLARLQHQRMAMAAQETEQRLSTVMREYQQIHAIYGDDPKNADKLDQALQNAAHKFGDQQMLSALNTVGHEGAMGLLKWYDAQHSDLKAANKTRAADEAQKERLAPYQLDPNEASGVPKPQPAEPDTTEPAQPAEPAQPGATPPPAAAPGEPPKPDTAAPGDTGTPTSGNPDVDTPGLDISDSSQPDQQQTQQADAGMTPEQQRFLRTATAAGASDLPDPAIGRLAQAQLPEVKVRAPGAQPVPEADDPMPQFDPQNSPVLTQAANGPWKMTNRNLVDQAAQDIVMGTSKITAKSDPELWRVANARALEIKQKLDAIEKSNLTGKGVLDQIGKVLPRFKGQLQAYVSGQSPVPSGARNQPMNAYILDLGHKVDPGWNEQTAKLRFAKMKDWTSGPGGRQWLSQITSLDHLDMLDEASRKVPSWYWEYMGKYGAGKAQTILDNLPGFVLKNLPVGQFEQDRKNILEFDALMKLVSPEIARAQKGAAGTQGEIRDFEGTMSAAEDPELRRGIIDRARGLIWHRAYNQLQQTAGEMGTTKEKLLAPYDRFRAGGGESVDPRDPKDAAPYVPARPGFDFKGTEQRVMVSPYPPGYQGPREGESPNTGAPSAQAHPQDDEALSWARAHPTDDRAKRILELQGR